MEIDDILRELDDGNAHDAGSDFGELNRCLVAERSCPELLPFQTELLERLMDRVRQKIELVELETGNLDPTSNFRLIIIQTELERVKYLIRSYLRARLHKIDKFAAHSLSDTHTRARLSPSESAYVKSHLALLNAHFQASCLRHLPEGMRRLDDVNTGVSMIETPDLQEAVLCRVVKDIDDTLRIPGRDDELHLQKDSLFMTRYIVVKDYIENGEIELI